MATTAEAAAERWRAELAAWEIPPEILRQVRDSPWVLPQRAFVKRADKLARQPSGRSFELAAEALATPGTVLDVGAGGGAASLPLVTTGRATALTAVDELGSFLAELRAKAAAAGVPVTAVEGRWPDVAGEVAPADLVVCHNVLYNVPDVLLFLRELDDHARLRVVLELTPRHPVARLNPLWRRFHGLDRPEGPTADDALAIARALGFGPRAERWTRQVDPDELTFDEAVEVTRRRLCLPPERAGEVAEALREQGGDSGGYVADAGTTGHEVVTIWWDTRPERAG